MDLTVVIPTYNRASLLAKTLQTLTTQSTNRFEVVVVDHGSSDDTAQMLRTYKDRINLKPHKIDRTYVTANAPRDYGARNAKSDTIVFLDCGIVVPQHFVQGHIDFHKKHTDCAALGYYHAHRVKRPDWAHSLHGLSIEELHKKVLEDEDLQDPRYLNRLSHGLSLSEHNLPWIFVWTGILSLSKPNYLEVGGFDVQQVYGFEDLEFGYRLYRHKIKLSYVDDGWGIELYHPRSPHTELKQKEIIGCRRAFGKHKSLALEVFLLRLLGLSSIHSHDLFTLFTELGKSNKDDPRQFYLTQERIPNNSLGIGFNPGASCYFDYYAAGCEDINVTEKVWGCLGILIPLPNSSLQSIYVSTFWKRLDYPLGEGLPTLLEVLVREVVRTSRSVVFIVNSKPSKLEETKIRVLKDLLGRYNFPYRLLGI